MYVQVHVFDIWVQWTSVSAEDAPLCALVLTIVALQRTGAGEFAMLDYGVHYSMDKARCYCYMYQ